jgi:26S proteasome regulatory subunit N12
MAHTATSEPGVGSGAAASGSGLPPASPTSARSVSSSALLSSPLIAFPVALEQQLMEGCYNQILSAKQRQSLPLPVYSIFLDSLADTVRNKIADCSEQAYDSLTVADLQRMMQLQSADEALKFVQSRAGWAVKGDKIVFLSKQAGANTQVDALKTIKQTLEYATELERIV